MEAMPSEGEGQRVCGANEIGRDGGGGEGGVSSACLECASLGFLVALPSRHPLSTLVLLLSWLSLRSLVAAPQLP